MIKATICTCIAIMGFAWSHAQPKLQKQWETDTLQVPESVLLHQKTQTLYVSLIGSGNTSALDGNGSIAIVDLKGNIIQSRWAIGLDSPKGLGLYGDKLYVADMKTLVTLSMKDGQIIDRLEFPSAGMLNDVTVDQRGNVFVSDSKGGVIYQVTNGKPSVFLNNLRNPNGILADGTDFYFLDSGSLFQVDNQKKVTEIASGMQKSTDGLQRYGQDFLISCWAGAIYHVSKVGTVSLLLNTQSEKMNTADFTFDNKTQTMYLPTFFKKQVIAYKVE